MIHMPLKWHHIDKCNKNCRKVDVLTSILVCLGSFAPINEMFIIHYEYILEIYLLYFQIDKK
jgi:hypothetical protein